MHGRVKVRTTAEQEALKKKERAEKFVRYRAGISVVFQKRKDKVYDDEVMLATECMLLQNPDIYTLWNVRREAFASNTWSNETLQELYTKELNLTENCLRKNPKSYCIWHQRSWIMERIAEADWKRELMLCAKCLNLDERNFHCWDYREFVVQRAGISATEEFEFSTSKIYSNFSNYSSWHYRSRLLAKIFKNSDEETIEKKKNEELELVMNAAFTDPSDSSAWFYHRWLLCTTSSPSLLKALLKPPHLTLCVSENLSSALLSLEINGKSSTVSWKTIKAATFSKLWFVDVNEEEIKSVRVGVGETYYNLECFGGVWMYKGKAMRKNEDLRDQLKNYEDLGVMEPDNKWALLARVVLMRRVDEEEFFEKILENLEKLQKVDSMRENYYKDLRSRYIIEHEFYKLCCTEQDLEIKSTIDLSGLGLTTLSCEEQLAFLEEVNLGANCLSHNLHSLCYLKNCRKLSLSSNGLKNLQNFPALENLEILVLRNNKLFEVTDIFDLLKKVKLCKLDLRDNPVCQNKELQENLARTYPELELCID